MMTVFFKDVLIEENTDEEKQHILSILMVSMTYLIM